MKLIQTSYMPDDVSILLKDLTDCIEPLSTEEREKRIQGGTHYSEMLPLEYIPTNKYFSLYEKALGDNSYRMALYTAVLAHKLYKIHGNSLVIVSLARAGIPIGILLKRYLKYMTGRDFPHYSISIIRGKGIDENALNYIRMRHPYQVAHFQFVDGWTGKGAINKQLFEAVEDLKIKDGVWDDLSPELAVLADPANICKICGTHEDILIPSSCLNSTICGLISRTILRNDLIDVAHGDFHGGVYFKEMEYMDVSYEFINTLHYFFSKIPKEEIDKRLNNNDSISEKDGLEYVKAVATYYDISDINMIKPGIGETTRVLLRRVPWIVLINSDIRSGRELNPVYQLCKEKNIQVERFGLGNYRCCGIIKNLSADA